MTQRQRRRRYAVPLGTMLPPPPPGVRYVRSPFLGIVIASDKLRDHVDRRFHWPMIVLALVMLPLLFVDFFYLHGHEDRTFSLLWWSCAVASALIWVAFTVEFIIKIAIAESRFEYVKRNWLDVIIILMPALRLLRVTYVVRTTRVFTLRGVGIKVARYVLTAVLGLELTERLMQRFGIKRDGRPNPATMTRHQLRKEVVRLRRLADRWAAWQQASEEHLRAQGYDPYWEEVPHEDAPEEDGSAESVKPNPA